MILSCLNLQSVLKSMHQFIHNLSVGLHSYRDENTKIKLALSIDKGHSLILVIESNFRMT